MYQHFKQYQLTDSTLAINGVRASDTPTKRVPPLKRATKKKVSSKSERYTDKLTRLWKGLFLLSDQLIDTAVESITFFDDQVQGEREVLFFLNHLLVESHNCEGGLTSCFAPINSDPNSIRQAIYDLAISGGTVDPLFPTGYTQVRFDKMSGKYLLSFQLTYRGRLHAAKRSGLLKDYIAKLVYRKDKFEWRGNKQQPMHHYSPFDSARGAILGGYCVTVRPNGDVDSRYYELSELKQILELSDQDIVNQWHEKMLLKTMINQTSKLWPYYVANPEDVIVDAKLERTTGNRESVDDFLAVAPVGDYLTHALCYGMSLIGNKQRAAKTFKEYVMALSSDHKLMEETPVFSKLVAFLALSKYQLSMNKMAQSVYLAPYKAGAINTVHIGIMYKGLREIAFNGVLKTTLEPPHQIEYELVYANDTVLYKGSYTIPDHAIDHKKPRGAIVGGYVIIHRESCTKVVYVDKSTLDRVAACAKSTKVQKTWSKQYAEKSVLRQSFYQWI